MISTILVVGPAADDFLDVVGQADIIMITIILVFIIPPSLNVNLMDLKFPSRK